MNPFHKPIEEKIEPYNSKLLLIPTIKECPYYHTSGKINIIL